MQVRKLTIASFRVFQEKSLEFTPGLNFIVGDNAKGKTTLLEAIYLLMAGKSFRTAQMNDLMCENSGFFRAEAHFEKWGIPQNLKMALQGADRKIQYNSSSLVSLSGLLGILQGVLLAPHDMELIKGAPAVRRHYLDFQIAQVDPLYVHHVMRYHKGIKQRNMQIRSRKIQTIDVFEEAIALSASYIIQKREAAVNALSALVNRYYLEISGKNDPVVLAYNSSSGSAHYEKILEKLKANRFKDMNLGFTSIGPHRDDLSLHISGKNARAFASEGEMRSLVAALKLAEWERIRDLTQEPPLLLVDDLGISLDISRLNNLLNVFSKTGQVIITSAADYSFVNKSNYNIIKL